MYHNQDFKRQGALSKLGMPKDPNGYGDRPKNLSNMCDGMWYNYNYCQSDTTVSEDYS